MARAAGTACLLLAAACGAPPTGPAPTTSHGVPLQGNGLPRPDHVVIAIMENHGLDQVLGSRKAPFLNTLVDGGAVFTNATAITHPSEPNYLALFSGDSQGVTDDECPYSFAAPNLGRQLLDANLGFAGYFEDLPSTGFDGCAAGDYARRHNPVVDFSTLPATANQPFTAFGTDFAALPTVSLVVPNMCHDMHDCGVHKGDTWLADNLGAYADWAHTHNSVLIVTWDEAEDGSATNQIPLIMAGQPVRPGRYAEPADHYRLLRTVEEMYGLAPLGHAATTSPITDAWQSSPSAP